MLTTDDLSPVGEPEPQSAEPVGAANVEADHEDYYNASLAALPPAITSAAWLRDSNFARSRDQLAEWLRRPAIAVGARVTVLPQGDPVPLVSNARPPCGEVVSIDGRLAHVKLEGQAEKLLEAAAPSGDNIAGCAGIN
jgi:hypothetical protein